MGNIGIYFWEELFRSERLWEGFQWIGAKHSDAKIWFFTTCNFKDDMIWCHKMKNSLATHCKVSKSESPKPRIVLWPLKQCTIVIGAKRWVGSWSVKMIVKCLPRAVQLSPFKYKHCQRHNGPEGWVHLAKVTSWGHITNLDHILSSESRLSIN